MALKGVEIPLPAGHVFTDKEDIVRTKIRVRWWTPATGKTYHDLSLPVSDTVPKLPIVETAETASLGYPEDVPPVFFGHYWLPADKPPVPLGPKVTSLDYSIAKGGALTAYRWDGEQTLDAGKFVQVRA